VNKTGSYAPRGNICYNAIMEDHPVKRTSVIELFVAKPLGRSKAAKFAAVEGLTLSSKSAQTLAASALSQQGGDGLREAITKSFKQKTKKRAG
jgi:hypothetical protein